MTLNKQNKNKIKITTVTAVMVPVIIYTPIGFFDYGCVYQFADGESLPYRNNGDILPSGYYSFVIDNTKEERLVVMNRMVH